MTNKEGVCEVIAAATGAIAQAPEMGVGGRASEAAKGFEGHFLVLGAGRAPSWCLLAFLVRLCCLEEV